MPNFLEVERKIEQIGVEEVARYSCYWCRIQPVTIDEKWQRWLFAALSIRAGWKANRAAYVALCGGGWGDEAQLSSAVSGTKIGLTSMRTKAIWRLEALRDRPFGFFDRPSPCVPWREWREARIDDVFGIGRAKVSFALEMCFPTECRVVCLDTHIQRLYGVRSKSTPGRALYEEIEGHWIDTCRAKSYPPALVRHILWDRLQGKVNTRYWSDVFETGQNLNEC